MAEPTGRDRGVMQTIRRVLQDVQQGKNIDLYLTVIAAVTVSVLSLLGVALPTWTASLTLAVLALLATGMLVNRKKLDLLIETTSTITEVPLTSQFPPELSSDIESASELWLVGARLIGTITNYHTVLERKLQRGDQIKALIVDPDGAASALEAMRDPGMVDVERVRAQMRAALRNLRELGKLGPDHLEIRVIDYPIEYGAIVVNPTTSAGTLYIRRYTFKVSVGDGVRTPKLVYRARDSKWYRFILEEIQALWENGSTRYCQEKV